jgi:sec-independent protein translocase protein TatA
MEWIILILAAVLLLFGAKKIPEFAQNLGKASAEFKRGKMMVEREIREEEIKADTKERESEDLKLRRAAKELGISTKGKSQAQLKQEIARKIS